MSGYRLQPRVVAMLDEIYSYTLKRWGKVQADNYAAGFFESFDRIASRDVIWRPIPATLGIKGFRYRHQRHLIYWRPNSDGKNIVFFAILHESMHAPERLSNVVSNDMPSDDE